MEVNNLLKINDSSKACNSAALLRKSLLYEYLVHFLLFRGILEHLTIDYFAFHVGDLQLPAKQFRLLAFLGDFSPVELGFFPHHLNYLLLLLDFILINCRPRGPLKKGTCILAQDLPQLYEDFPSLGVDRLWIEVDCFHKEGPQLRKDDHDLVGLPLLLAYLLGNHCFAFLEELHKFLIFKLQHLNVL